ncbi:hypothetical protein PM082_018842 [Marasmius tenuissimus]|nr:hypothetical protein PM082_018842 [Marasmius tenuissimus]
MLNRDLSKNGQLQGCFSYDSELSRNTESRPTISWRKRASANVYRNSRNTGLCTFIWRPSVFLLCDLQLIHVLAVRRMHVWPGLPSFKNPSPGECGNAIFIAKTGHRQADGA